MYRIETLFQIESGHSFGMSPAMYSTGQTGGMHPLRGVHDLVPGSLQYTQLFRLDQRHESPEEPALHGDVKRGSV